MRAMPATARSGVPSEMPPPNGLVVRIDGMDLPLAREGQRWYASARDPFPGSVNEDGLHRRWIDAEADAGLEVFEQRTSGIYLEIPMEVGPSSESHLVALFGSGDTLQYLGFERFDRDVWAKIVPVDDPDLRFEVTRTPISPPWVTGWPPRDDPRP